jgi:hypothetical protein
MEMLWESADKNSISIMFNSFIEIPETLDQVWIK